MTGARDTHTHIRILYMFLSIVGSGIYRGTGYRVNPCDISPVDFKSNPEISCLNRQDIPLDRNFSALYNGISCQFVGVEQFSQSMKL